MDTPFIGREALDAGLITRHDLRGRFVTVYPGVYVAAGTQPTPTDRARAAWLWSKRKGVLAGLSAAAMHGAKWLDPHAPAALLYWNRRPPNGIHTWARRRGGRRSRGPRWHAADDRRADGIRPCAPHPR